MLLKFEPKARDFKVGDRVVICCLGGGTLSGDHRVVKITRTHYHIAIPHYKTPSLFRRDDSTGSAFSAGGIITVEEARAEQQAYKAGRIAGPDLKQHPTLLYGSGEI